MKKKLILTISLIAMLLCAFAFCVSAEEITVNTITSDTYGTVYQLSADPGLDNVDEYVSTLNNIVDAGTDKDSLSVMWDGTYYYVFPTSYITYEISNGKFEVYVGTDSKPGVNQAFAEWNEAEGTSLPQFELTGSYGSTNVKSLIRIEISKDVLYFDASHCKLCFTNLKEVRFQPEQSVTGSLFNSAPALETVIGLENCKNFNGTTHFFRGCVSLTTVSLPEDITTIGKETFWGCSSLVEVSNWDKLTKVTSIGQEAFKGCTQLENIYLSSVTSIGISAFHSCKALTSVDLSSVTSIGGSAFNSCEALTSVDLCSVTSMGTHTFQYCSNLNSIGSFNSALTSIPQDSFRGTKLTSVTIPENVTSIGGYAFCDCNQLTSVSILSNKITSVAAQAFYGCSSLTAIKLPDSVSDIGSGAFKGCSSLTEFDVPNSLVTLGSAAFQNCSQITRFEFPPTTTSFGQDCFHGCAALTYVNVPRDCTSIGNYTFAGCGNLEVLDMSEAKSLKSAGTNNGSYGKVTSLVFPEGFESFGGISSSTLTELVFPNSTKTLGVIKSTVLKEFVVPAGVTSLGDKAFDYCASLEKVTIPAGCTSIATTGNTAFFGSTKNNLKTIVFTGNADDAVLESIKTLLPNATIEFANHCEVYYEGEHIEGNPTVSFVGEEFLSVAQLCDDCTRCTKTVVLKEAAPLFTSKGWTYSLDGAELSQGFKIEKENIDFYNEHFGIVGFGVVGAIHTYFDKDGNEQTYTENSAFISVVDGKVVTTGAIAAGFENSDYSIFAMKMTGLTGDNQKAKIYLSAYVATADNVYYLSNNQASVDAATDSTSIYALLQKEETVE